MPEGPAGKVNGDDNPGLIAIGQDIHHRGKSSYLAALMKVESMKSLAAAFLVISFLAR